MSLQSCCKSSFLLMRVKENGNKSSWLGLGLLLLCYYFCIVVLIYEETMNDE